MRDARGACVIATPTIMSRHLYKSGIFLHGHAIVCAGSVECLLVGCDMLSQESNSKCSSAPDHVRSSRAVPDAGACTELVRPASLTTTGPCTVLSPPRPQNPLNALNLMAANMEALDASAQRFLVRCRALLEEENHHPVE